MAAYRRPITKGCSWTNLHPPPRLDGSVSTSPSRKPGHIDLGSPVHHSPQGPDFYPPLIMWVQTSLYLKQNALTSTRGCRFFSRNSPKSLPGWVPKLRSSTYVLTKYGSTFDNRCAIFRANNPTFVIFYNVPITSTNMYKLATWDNQMNAAIAKTQT